MGGTDDQDNLIELTVEKHAEAHRKLYEQYGKKEDYLAWKGLEGKIGKDEIMREKMSLNSSRPGKLNPFYGKKHTQETKDKISKAKKGVSIKMPPHSEEHKKKLSEIKKASAKKYKFEHKDGRIFVGSTRDLARLVGSNGAEPWKLIKGIYKTHKGWKVIKDDK